MTLKTKILAACAFDKSDLYDHFEPDMESAGKSENGRLLPTITALCDQIEMLKGALEALPIGRAHNVKSYDCDGDPTCHEGCPACSANEVLNAHQLFVEGVGK